MLWLGQWGWAQHNGPVLRLLSPVPFGLLIFDLLHLHLNRKPGGQWLINCIYLTFKEKSPLLCGQPRALSHIQTSGKILLFFFFCSFSETGPARALLLEKPRSHSLLAVSVAILEMWERSI